MPACIDEIRPEAATWLEARSGQAEAVTARELDTRIRSAPRDSRTTWVALKGHWLGLRGRHEAALEPLREAVSAWTADADIDAELCARHLVAYHLTRAEQLDAALSEATLALERARVNSRAERGERLAYLRLRLMLMLDLRLEQALVELEQLPEPDDPLTALIRDDTRATLLFRLGYLPAAAEAYRGIMDRSLELGQSEIHSAARNNLARSLSRMRYDSPDSIEMDALVDIWESVIDDPEARPRSRMMAMFTIAGRVDLQRSLALMVKCRNLGTEHDQHDLAAACRARQAEYLADTNPGAAREHLAAAWSRVEEHGSLRDRQRLLRPSLKVHWKLDPPVEAMAASRDLLAVTEALRAVQMRGPERARILAYWTSLHRLTAAAALERAADDTALQAEALALMEEVRARVLRERLNRSREDDPGSRARHIAGEINQVQSVLIRADMTAAQVEYQHARLDELESRYHARSVSEPDSGPAPEPVRLVDLQARLAPDEALVSFFTDTRDLEEDPAAGGWVQVITADDIRSRRVPGVLELETWSEMLAGRKNWEDPRIRGMLTAISGALVGPVVEMLPSRVRRLIVIPDAGMETLPLAMLPVGDAKLGTRYELDQVPSATLWNRLRDRRRTAGPALVLADPALEGLRPDRLDPDFAGDLPPLPGARAEARRLERLLGDKHVRVQTGDEARESALANTGGLGMLHFATHTLVHPSRPERSAVMLTPGGDGADGLLQGPEIERLDLAGAAAYLATCSSASGAWLEGEGILSLARSFMLAGAGAVIATRWPVADAHAAAFSEAVYRHMAAGRTLSEAMRRARGDLIEDGYPPEAWAAYVLIGDGRWQPVPTRPLWPPLAWIAMGLILAGISFRTRRRRD